MIILKVTKNQGFNLPLKDTFLQKPQGWGGSQIDPSVVLGLRSKMLKIKIIALLVNIFDEKSYRKTYITSHGFKIGRQI